MREFIIVCSVLTFTAACDSFPERSFGAGDIQPEDVSGADTGEDVGDGVDVGGGDVGDRPDVPVDDAGAEVGDDLGVDAGDCERNECGGCEPLREAELIGEACGTCDTGTWECDTPETVVCFGDEGDDALNGCGGCEPLLAQPGEICGVCPLEVLECTQTGETECRLPVTPALGEPILPDTHFVHPEASITMDYTFAMGRTEVTQAQWSRLGFPIPRQNFPCAYCPVIGVRFLETIAYANAVSAARGLTACYFAGEDAYNLDHALANIPPQWPARFACEGYRIPTEMEWIVAVRYGLEPGAGLERNLDDVAWWAANGDQTTKETACLEPTPLGLFDMLGNADERVYDAYFGRLPDGELQDYVYEMSTPLGSVLRGGNVLGVEDQVSVFYRADARRSDPSYTGFRLVRTLR